MVRFNGSKRRHGRFHGSLYWLLVFLCAASLFLSLGGGSDCLFRERSQYESNLRTIEELRMGSPVKATTENPVNPTLPPLPPLVSGAKTKTWDNWPATAYEENDHPLVTKGESFFNRARDIYLEKQPSGKTLLNEFLEVYKNRPDPVNLCGIRINHAMALFLAVKQIKPTLVVESGVNAGVSTYFIRAASPTTKIFAIDPLEKPICGQGERWIDSSELTINYTGEKFVDLLELDWKGMIEKKEIDPESTLVFIDDHLHTFQRIAGVQKVGFRHVLVEDNYKLGEGATPEDKRSTPKQMFSGGSWSKEGNWLFQNIVKYAEFPPIVPPIMAKEFSGERKKAGGFMVASDKNNDIVGPILRPDLNDEDKKTYTHMATFLDIDPTLKDKNSYMQFMNYNQICYLELLPMPPTLIS